MPQGVEIVFDEARLKEIERLLAGVPRALPKVVTRALNKTATRARAELVRRTARRMAITQKTVRAHLKLWRASYRKWVATLRIGAGWIPLSAWRPRWKRTWEGARSRLPAAFSARVMLGGQKTEIPMDGTFMARHQVFVRAPGAKRLPIIRVYGPSVVDAYESAPAEAAALLKEANRRLEMEIDRQVAVLLERGR